MRRKDREITDLSEIREILEEGKVLRLALSICDRPYIVPLFYGFEEKDGNFVFYMHSAKEGKKLDYISTNSHGAIEIEKDFKIIKDGEGDCSYSALFSSVVGEGRIEILEDEEEREKGINLMMKNLTGKDFALTSALLKNTAVLKFTPLSLTAKARKV